MAQTHKRLAQTKPAASTNTTHYTVPAATTTIITSMVICNTNTSTVKVRVFIAGTAVDNAILYDFSIGANQSFILNIALVGNANEVVTVYSNTANVTFTSSGLEIA